MSISFIDPLTDPRYERFVAAHPDATVFHTSSWIHVLHEAYGFRPGCVALIEGDTIRGLLPFMETKSITNIRKCVSLPFSDFCEPLFDNSSDFHNALEQLIHEANKRRWRHIEIRGGKQFLAGIRPSQRFLTHNLDLTRSGDDLVRSFRSSTQRNTRKAEKEGITVTFDQSGDAIKEFYRLNCLTRRYHGLPPQPFSFFDRLHKDFIQGNSGFISLAHFRHSIIAGALFVVSGKIAYYKYGASEKKFLCHRPNDLIFLEVIKECASRGCIKLNFGRTELTHKGLLQFKRNFGTIENEICYYLFDCDRREFISRSRDLEMNSWFTKTVSLFPIPVLQVIGRLFYRFVG